MMRIRKMLCAALAVCVLGSVLPSLAEGTAMKALQERLISLGYEIGTADGIVGKKTSAAIMLAQEALRENGHDVRPSGTPDPETVSLIMQEENADLLRTLRPGSWGSQVKQVQKQLAGLNLLQDSADGKYGANTEAAVKAFEDAMAKQVPEKITADGRLTPDEYDLLMGDLRAYGFEAPICFDDSHPEKLNGNYLYAKHACLINAVTGESLLEKDADTPAEPASTTKIMTLITALPLCDPDKVIVIPEEALDIPADSTRVPVYPGEKMTMKDLLYGMMIRSGNDAANSVAVLCSGSVDAFAEEMNKKAKELGMANSRFVNPHGYTAEGHSTSARDLVTAARYGLTQPLFREIVTCMYYTLPVTEQRKDPLISLKWEIFDPGSEYYIPHAAGGKSGYTSTAGFCYVGAYQEDGITLIAAVMGGRGRNMAWTDLRRLFAYGMAMEKAAE
ncbi:peptidoglycan-binding protein [Clostridiales bacterium]|nr:peptidoglycan-binding protein [Clostridiales bacterium]